MECALTKVRRDYMGTWTKIGKAINVTKFHACHFTGVAFSSSDAIESASRLPGTIQRYRTHPRYASKVAMDLVSRRGELRSMSSVEGLRVRQVAVSSAHIG